MQLEQLLSGSNLPVLLAAGCCLLCVIGVLITVLTPVFNLLGGLLDIASALFSVGPLPGCGCVVALAVVGGLILCGAMVLSVAGTCGTPEAANFCILFGR